MSGASSKEEVPWKRLNCHVQNCTQIEVLVRLVWSGCFYWRRSPTLWRWLWLSNEFAFNLIRTRSIALRFSEYLQLLLGNIWDQIIFVVGNKVATYCNWDCASSISPLGKEVFLNTLQGALETFKLSRAKLYPN
jgi:hypothetical protein